MAMGKDSPERFIDEALTGGNGPSEGIVDKSIGGGQTIKSAYPLDNVGEIAGPDLPNTMGGPLKDTGLSRSISGSVGKSPGQND